MAAGDPVKVTSEVVEAGVDEIVAAVEALDAQTGADLSSLLTALESIHDDLVTLHADLLTVITKLAGGLPSVLSGDKLKVTGLL